MPTPARIPDAIAGEYMSGWTRKVSSCIESQQELMQPDRADEPDYHVLALTWLLGDRIEIHWDDPAKHYGSCRLDLFTDTTCTVCCKDGYIPRVSLRLSALSAPSSSSDCASIGQRLETSGEIHHCSGSDQKLYAELLKFGKGTVAGFVLAR